MIIVWLEDCSAVLSVHSIHIISGSSKCLIFLIIPLRTKMSRSLLHL